MARDNRFMARRRHSREAPTGRTVGEVAALAHVTVRTLHHYDEVGLVSPSARSDAGYRLYAPEDLERLQQVLFYRELGFALEDIRALMDASDFDRGRALREQRRLLEEQGDRVRAMLDAVDAAIAAHEGGYAMSEQEMFQVFGDFNPKDHEDEAHERWGETDAYKQSAERTRRYRKEDWEAIKAEAEGITQSFVRALTSGAPATSEAAMATAEAHRQHISRWFYECSPEFHRNLGEMQTADDRFAATWEAIRPGLASYVRDAFVANAEAQQ